MVCDEVSTWEYMEIHGGTWKSQITEGMTAFDHIHLLEDSNIILRS